MAKTDTRTVETFAIAPMTPAEALAKFADSMPRGSAVVTEAGWQRVLTAGAKQAVSARLHTRLQELSPSVQHDGDQFTVNESGEEHGDSLLTAYCHESQWNQYVTVSLRPHRSWGAGRKLPSRSFDFSPVITKAALADIAEGKPILLDIKGPWAQLSKALDKTITTRRAQVADERTANTQRQTEDAQRKAAEAPVQAALEQVLSTGSGWDLRRAYGTKVDTSGYNGTYTFTLHVGDSSKPLGSRLAAELLDRMDRMGNARVELTLSNLTAEQTTYLLEALPQQDEAAVDTVEP